MHMHAADFARILGTTPDKILIEPHVLVIDWNATTQSGGIAASGGTSNELTTNLDGGWTMAVEEIYAQATLVAATGSGSLAGTPAIIAPSPTDASNTLSFYLDRFDAKIRFVDVDWSKDWAPLPALVTTAQRQVYRRNWPIITGGRGIRGQLRNNNALAGYAKLVFSGARFKRN